jgi:glutamate dehydrogenase (NAD(P)+)
VLLERGITVVPDFITNAGGVVAAAVAMDARYTGIRPEPAAVFDNAACQHHRNAGSVEDAKAHDPPGRPASPPRNASMKQWCWAAAFLKPACTNTNSIPAVAAAEPDDR